MATILDVAKMCGYSKATVSRAFASPEQVTEKTRDKVYEAARAIGYTPDAIARAMVRGQTENIAFIIYEKQYPVVLNPFYSPIFESVLQTSTKRGYSLFISSEKDVRLPNGQVYIKKHMDGVILAGKTDAQTVMDLRRQGIKVVLVNSIVDFDDLICVTTDQYGGAVQAMNHLIECGHRKIGLIAGDFSQYVYSARYNGYVDVLKENGIEINYNYIHTIEANIDAAQKSVEEILKLEDRPTALFCTNDTIAVGAMKACTRAGLKIPEDMAIIGFDDSEMCRLVEPELSTIRVDKERMGQIAVEKLIDLIEGRAVEGHIIETKTELIRRGTT